MSVREKQILHCEYSPFLTHPRYVLPDDTTHYKTGQTDCHVTSCFVKWSGVPLGE